MVVSIHSAEGQNSASSEAGWIFTIGTSLEFVLCLCSKQFALTTIEQNKVITYFHCHRSWISLVSDLLLAIEHCYGQSWHPHDYWLIAGLIVREQQAAAPQGRTSWKLRVTPGRDSALRQSCSREEGWAEQGAGDRVCWQSQTGQGGESGSGSTWDRRQDWREDYHVCQGSIQKTGLETCTPPAVLRTRLGASPELTWSPRTGAYGVWGLPGRMNAVRAYGCPQDSDTYDINYQQLHTWLTKST